MLIQPSLTFKIFLLSVFWIRYILNNKMNKRKPMSQRQEMRLTLQKKGLHVNNTISTPYPFLSLVQVFKTSSFQIWIAGNREMVWATSQIIIQIGKDNSLWTQSSLGWSVINRLLHLDVLGNAQTSFISCFIKSFLKHERPFLSRLNANHTQQRESGTEI